MSQYIFIAGAPGSKWSSVAKNIYFSPDIDDSDFSPERTYRHSAWGEPQLMHFGAYFDPGMEFGTYFDKIDKYTKAENENEFNKPFSGHSGHRIIKSHIFCNHLDYLKNNWDDMPIIIVQRPDDACLGWWVKCGGFNITYPDYSWYGNLSKMARHIYDQNQGIKKFLMANKTIPITNSWLLCDLLKIERPSEFRSYIDDDVKVNLYWSKYE